MNKTIVIFLIILNVVVLLGQIWPEGAPPFARIVIIHFLVATLAFFIMSIKNNTTRIK